MRRAVSHCVVIDIFINVISGESYVLQLRNALELKTSRTYKPFSSQVMLYFLYCHKETWLEVLVIRPISAQQNTDQIL